MIKDKLPDKGSAYETADSKVEDSLEVLLMNLEEMNKLWCRI